MKKIIVILVLLISKNALAGRPVLDSLGRNAKVFALQKPSFGRDTLLISALWDLTYHSIYFREKNTKKLLDSLENLTNHTNWRAGKGLFLIDKSFYQAVYLNDFSKSLTYALESKDILKNTSSFKALAFANIRLASLYAWNMGNVPNEKEKFSIEGIRAAKEVIEIGNKIQNMDIKCYGLVWLANHYNIVDNYIPSENALKLAKSIIEKQEVSYLSASNFYSIYGVMFSATNRIEKALEYWDKSLKMCYLQDDFYNLSAINRLKSDYYFRFAKKKNLNLALSLAKESYKYARRLGVLKFISAAEKNIYLINKLKGNNDEAIKYLEYHWVHEDSLSIERTQKTYADYDFLKKETQIKTLENEKLQTEANRQKMIRNLLIVSLLAGIGFVFYVGRNNQKLKAKNREIEEAMLKGQTTERKRVAAELHDNLSAKISGIRWRLESIQPIFEVEKHQKIYDSSVNALSEIYTDVRLIAHNLLPEELETKGLKAAIEKLISELNSLGKTQFLLDNINNLGRFSNKIEYEIYSIILELSNNILKHSKAKSANIFLEKIGNKMILKVSDNGIGIEHLIDLKGMGIDNLKSRVETLRGKVQFFNKNGLTVKIEILV